MRFHQDLTSSIEFEAIDRISIGPNMDLVDTTTAQTDPYSLSQPPWKNYGYSLSSFVAVLATDNEESMFFPVGSTVDMDNGPDVVDYNLSVHWYKFYWGSETYAAN